MSSFIEALEGEIAFLERELSTNPTFVKLQGARQLLDAYRLTETKPPKIAVQQDAYRTARQFASGNSAVIIDFVRSFLRGQTGPTPARDIMGALTEQGIQIGGTLPQNSVNSLLSKSDDFISHGRAGWTLAVTEKAGDDAPDKDASPASVQPSAPVEPGGEVAHDNITDADG